MFFFDARFIRTDHHDGISRFTANLCSEISKLRDTTAIICDLRQLEFLPTGIKYILECEQTSIREIGLARRLNRAGATLVYSPMQTTSSSGKSFKLVLTLHDLIYYRHREPPGEFNSLLRLGWRLYHLTYWPARFLLSKADGVVTISKHSKALILKNQLYDGPMEIVYNAPESSISTGAPALRREKTLVYMGSFMPYKDVETLVRAMRLLPEYRLLLLSKISESRKAQLTSLAGPSASRLDFFGGVSDEKYSALLSNATALVTASRDEGFGIPLVEAMQLGTPVVCTDIPIFREVAGDAAEYFAAGNSTAFAEAIANLESKWQQQSKESLKVAKKYSWQTSAVTLNAFLEQFD